MAHGERASHRWDLILLVPALASLPHVHDGWCAGRWRRPRCPNVLQLLSCAAGRTWGPCRATSCKSLSERECRTLPNIYLENFTFAFHTPPYTQMDVFPISLTSAQAGRTETGGNIIFNVRDLKYNLFRARSDSDRI